MDSAIANLLGGLGPGALIAISLFYVAMQVKRFAVAFEDRDKKDLELLQDGVSVARAIHHELRIVRANGSPDSAQHH